MIRVSVSAGFVFGFAALWLFDESGALSAMIPAAAAHELGHAAVLMTVGAGISEIRLEASGLRMDYIYPPGPVGEAFAAAAGPGMGILYSTLCSALGNGIKSEFLLCSAGISLVLSIFNLLPASALDGGRILRIFLGRTACAEVSWKIMLALDIVISVAFIAVGIWYGAHAFGIALIPSGIWVIAHSLAEYCKNHGYGIK